MRRLQLFRPGAVVELVPYEVEFGHSRSGERLMKVVPDRWAMPGRSTKTTEEILALAEEEDLRVNFVQKNG